VEVLDELFSRDFADGLVLTETVPTQLIAISSTTSRSTR